MTLTKYKPLLLNTIHRPPLSNRAWRHQQYYLTSLGQTPDLAPAATAEIFRSFARHCRAVSTVLCHKQPQKKNFTAPAPQVSGVQ